MSLVLGLDVGTQSDKLAAYEPSAHRVVVIRGRSLELRARNTWQKTGTDGRLA
jgi:sugar (pentulose or hexulose) kinase